MYEPVRLPGDPPSITQYSLEHTIFNSSQTLDEVSYHVGFTVSGAIGFTDELKLKLEVSDTFTWGASTSSKQSATTNQSSHLHLAQPTYGYTGPTLVRVYLDKVWKTFVFSIDSY
jgi:hypothetical protein